MQNAELRMQNCGRTLFSPTRKGVKVMKYNVINTSLELVKRRLYENNIYQCVKQRREDMKLSPSEDTNIKLSQPEQIRFDIFSLIPLIDKVDDLIKEFEYQYDLQCNKLK
jgi:hypothetical protein